jgi:hypothetical protein
MLRVTRALLSSSSIKRSTGLVGLDVVPNAREVLTKLYQKTLNDIKVRPSVVAGASWVLYEVVVRQPCAADYAPRTPADTSLTSPLAMTGACCPLLQIIPETAAYRQDVEQFTKFRMQVVKDNEDVRTRRTLSTRAPAAEPPAQCRCRFAACACISGYRRSSGGM